MRYLLVFAAWLLTAPVLGADEDWLPLTPAVVRVQAANGGGSGTLVYADGDEGYVVTCRHVVEGASSATALWRDGYRASGPVVGIGQSYDTAIFRVRPPANPIVIPIAEEPPAAGADVEVLGYGGQAGLIHWASKLHGYKRLGNAELFQIDPLSVSGDSGGPVVYRGELVGIVSGGQLASFSGPAIDAHGPPCRPIRNLLRAIAPHALVAAADRLRAQQCPPGGSCPPAQWIPPSRRQPVPRQPVPQVLPTPVQVPPVADPLKEYRESLDRLEKTVAGIQEQLKTMPNNSAELADLLNRQRELNDKIQRLSAVPDRVAPLESTVGTVHAAVTALQGDVGAVTQRLAVVDAEAVREPTLHDTIRSATADLIQRVDAKTSSFSWWQTLAGTLGVSGPLSLAAVVAAWLATRGVKKRIEGLIQPAAGAPGVAPQPFRGLSNFGGIGSESG